MSLDERRIRVFLVVVATFAAISMESVQADQASSQSVPVEKLPASTLIYVSDYFSFIGADGQGRTIPGRVIYEYLVMPEFNRLTRTYWGMWNEFQGLYLLADGSNDIYLHSQQSERMAALAGTLVGFSVFNELPESLNDLRVE